MHPSNRAPAAADATTSPPPAGPGLPPSGERGLSLIEIMVSIIVLVGGMFGLIQAMIAANRLERAADERKLAYAFCNSQIEAVRALGFANVSNLTSASTPGYLIPGTIAGSNNSAVISTLGFKQSSDADADPDRFGLYYTSNAAAANYNPLLAGLAVQSGFTRVAEVVFVDPYAVTTTFTNSSQFTKAVNPATPTASVTTGLSTGVAEGEGYWVSVRVFWKGVLGDQEVSLCTFLSYR